MAMLVVPGLKLPAYLPHEGLAAFFINIFDPVPSIACIQISGRALSSCSLHRSYTTHLPSGEMSNFFANSFVSFVICVVSVVLKS